MKTARIRYPAITLDKNSGIFVGHHPTRRSCQEVLKTSRVEWGLVRRCWESHGIGWVGSDQKVFKSSGSGRVALTRLDP